MSLLIRLYIYNYEKLKHSIYRLLLPFKMKNKCLFIKTEYWIINTLID